MTKLGLCLNLSLRIGGYESERAVLVSETPQNGEILAAVCPNNKTIITAGTSTVRLFIIIYLA